MSPENRKFLKCSNGVGGPGLAALAGLQGDERGA